ncbi:hypothetical protein [Rhodoplanes sp. SY1]|uniref:hypothetical protein n=1 Tax=Rhodoplanes sp. SY1 TaxID=3166646 RepID=UPI0038B44250
MSETETAPADPADTDPITIEDLISAKVFANRRDVSECVVQITTTAGHRFVAMGVDDLRGIAERFAADAALISNSAVGRA